MRTRALVFLLALIAATQACSSDRTADPNVEALASSAKSPAKSRPNYDWMGKFHNDALDYALVKIVASKKATKLDRCRVGLIAVKDFSREFRKVNGSPLHVDPDLIDGMCEAAMGGGSIQSAFVAPTNTISPVAQGYMNQIADALDYTSSTEAYASAVNQITNAAATSLGDGSLEAGAVYGTASIGVSSGTYWATNTSAWSNPGSEAAVRFAPTGPVFQVLGPRARRIIRADILGATTVLLRDWWMGEFALEKAAIAAAAASLIEGLLAL